MVEQNKSPPATIPPEGGRSVLDCPYKSFRLHFYGTVSLLALGLWGAYKFVSNENKELAKFNEDQSKQRAAIELRMDAGFNELKALILQTNTAPGRPLPPSTAPRPQGPQGPGKSH
jgi:hypothetical protein